jgi:hypothetical protein
MEHVGISILPNIGIRWHVALSIFKNPADTSDNNPQYAARLLQCDFETSGERDGGRTLRKCVRDWHRRYVPVGACAIMEGHFDVNSGEWKLLRCPEFGNVTEAQFAAHYTTMRGLIVLDIDQPGVR